MPVPLDEYPVHQVPLSMRYMETSDRNSYDRSYWNAQDRTGEVFLVSGLGVYPNLGVIDAYATIATPGRQVAMRTSGPLGDDRMVQQVGPYRIEVIEPLQKLRLVCEAEEQGITFDLTWNGSFPTHEEPRHETRAGTRILLDAARFAQVGSWEGTLRVDDQTWDVTPDTWLGSPRPVVGDPSGGRAARPRAARRVARRAQLLVALHAVPVRRLLPVRDRAGGRRRAPLDERGDPRVGRRPHRAAGLDGHRDRVPLRLPSSRAGRHAPAATRTRSRSTSSSRRSASSRSRSGPATAATTGPTASGWGTAGSTA